MREGVRSLLQEPPQDRGVGLRLRPARVVYPSPGSPLVIVPVLSRATTCTRPVSSREAAVLNSIPFFAPTPLPTIMATGVARPNAQGQLMTSTDMPRRKRKAHLTAQEQPYRRRHRRYGHYHRHEYAGDLIGHFCNRRLCGGSVAHHGNYLRERCILAHAGSPAAYVSRNITRCCGNAVPNIFCQQVAFCL